MFLTAELLDSIAERRKQYSFQVSVSCAQELGNRNHQDDRFIILPFYGGYLLAVADGHGSSCVSDGIAALLPKVFSEVFHGYWSDVGTLDNLTLELEEEILAKVFERLIMEFEGDNSGSTLSVVFIRPALPFNDGRQRFSVIAAHMGDSPIVIHHNDGLYISPLHSAAHNKADIADIESRADDVDEFGKEIYDGAMVSGGYVWLCGYSMDRRRGLAVTRAIGDREFTGLLIRKPQVYSVYTDDSLKVLMASDGVLVSGSEQGIEEDLDRLVKQVEGGDSASDVLNGMEVVRDNATVITFCFLDRRNNGVR